MAVTMPTIEVVFKQLAGSLIERSERGIAILIVKDDTDQSFSYKSYSDITQLDEDKEKYTDDNYNAIRDCLTFSPVKCYVFRINAEDGTLNEALKNMESRVKTGWITVVGGQTEDFTGLVSWIKSKENKGKTYKAVVYKTATTDSRHIVNFYNDKVTFADERGEKEGSFYCPSLVGILASCNVKRGCAYFTCTNLTEVQEFTGEGDIDENRDEALGAGKFILFNDDDVVKIARGINSLTTTDGLNLTEDMKFIDIVETMDLINDDISKAFIETYLGRYKNNYDNQMLFVSAINSYFTDLENERILDNNYNNTVTIDTETQRNSWLGVGKTEAADWDDVTIKNNTFKRSVFLKGDIKILGAMEDLKFTVYLF